MFALMGCYYSRYQRPREDKMILIIEDDYDLRLVYQDIFKSISQDTVIYGSAEEVFNDMDYLRKQNIQVMISDYHLSGINGLDFLKRAKEMLTPSLCILTTGNPPAMIPEDIFLFSKPGRFPQLLKTVNACLKE